MEEAIRVLTARLGRAPGEDEIAAEMEMGLDEYQQLLGDLKGLEIGTLHVERNENSGEEELAYVPGKPEDDPLFHCLRGELEERLTDAIAHLPDRERLVMTLYYYEEMTMREIGLALGVVESRVSQVHASAVVHLRAALRDLARAERRRTGAGACAERCVRQERRAGVSGGRVRLLAEKTLKQDEIDALFRGRAQPGARGRARRGARQGGALQLFLGRPDFDRAVARHQHAERSVCAQPDA